MKLAFTTRALVLATTLLTLSSFCASADKTVFRWKDDAGNQVNSDRPPPQGTEYEVISTKSSMVREVDSDESAGPLAVKPTAENKPEPVAKSKAKTEKNPESCARARDNLLQIDSHGRIRLRNDQGEVRYLTQEEKEAEREKTLEAIKVFCE